MDVRVDHRWEIQKFEVTFYTRLPASNELVIHNVDGSERERLPLHSPKRVDIEPTFLIDEAGLKGLVAAASNHLPASSATERHLGDAIEVRDRLLTIVERAKGAGL